MKNILIFIIILFLIVIIFIKLYFSYYEKFTVPSVPPTEPICPEANILYPKMVGLYKTTSNLNNILKEAKTAANALPENQKISTLFTTIPNQFSDLINKANIYSNLLITDRLNRSELDKTFDNIKQSIIILDSQYSEIYSNIIKYNSNPIKQTYDTAIKDFQLSYDDYNTKFNYYMPCILAIQAQTPQTPQINQIQQNSNMYL